MEGKRRSIAFYRFVQKGRMKTVEVETDGVVHGALAVLSTSFVNDVGAGGLGGGGDAVSNNEGKSQRERLPIPSTSPKVGKKQRE